MLNETIVRDLKRATDLADKDAKRRLLAPGHRLSPAVALLESSAAACVLGSMQRRTGDDGGAGLVLGAALQAFALFADDSPFAPHAEALASGILAACAYRCGVGGPGPDSPPVRLPARPGLAPRTSRQWDLAIARLTISERV